MRRFWERIATLYRRWRLVEEAPLPCAATSPAGSEAQRLRLAIEREERLSADYRRNGCLSFAKEREASARALRSRLAILEG